MRIAHSRLSVRGGSLGRRVGNARTEWKERAGVLLALRDEGGREGLGEASPLPGHSREDLQSCRAALAGVHLELGEIDETAPAQEAITSAVDGLARVLPAAARFALETALFDLVAQRRGCSIAECLGGHRPWPSVERSGLLDPCANDRVAAARDLLARGIRTVKVKVGAGRDFRDERRALAAVRDAVGLDVKLRLDANGAWEVAEARERLAQLAPLAPEFVEEPTGGERLLELGPTAVPWAADESLALPGLAGRLIAATGCAAVVLKPALVGGLVAAYRLAAAAQAAQLGAVVTHLFDGPVGLAAACELALSLPKPPLACGLDVHAGLGVWPACELPQLREAGAITPSRRPGLGLAGVEV